MKENLFNTILSINKKVKETPFAGYVYLDFNGVKEITKRELELAKFYLEEIFLGGNIEKFIPPNGKTLEILVSCGAIEASN